MYVYAVRMRENSYGIYEFVHMERGRYRGRRGHKEYMNLSV
jgi:hypothetical protein